MDNLEMIRRLLEISGSLDIETMGLEPGSGIHEIAYARLNKDLSMGEISQYILEPNAVVSVDELGNAHRFDKAGKPTSLTTIYGGRGTGPAAPFLWEDVDVLNRVVMEGAPATGLPDVEGRIHDQMAELGDEDIMKRITAADPFRAKAMRDGTYPWLPSYNEGTQRIVNPATLGMTPEQISRIEDFTRDAAAKAGIPGVNVRTQRLAVEELLRRDSGLSRQLRDNITWIANTQFESRQIGAHLAAYERDIIERAMAENIDEQAATARAHSQSFRHDVPYQNPRSSGLLYTTGREYNLARSRAVTGTGTWKEAWKTMLQHTGKGDVRDIFDLMKMQEEYLREIAPGLLSPQTTVTGGVDIQYRLMMAAERGAEGFALAEPHIAAVDAPIQLELAKRLMPETAAMQAVSEGTAWGKQLMEQAAEGKGLLHRAMMRHSMNQALMPDFQRSNILKRLDEAYRDIAINQNTRQHTHHVLRDITVQGPPMIGPLPAGQDVRPNVSDTWTIPQQKHANVTSLQGVIEHMEGLPKQYPAEILREEVDRYMSMMGEAVPEGLDEAATRQHLLDRSRTGVAARREALVGEAALEAAFERAGGREQFVSNVRGAVSTQKLRITPQGINLPGVSGLGRGALLFAGAIGAVGAAGAIAGVRGNDPPPSLRRVNYQGWLEQQDEYFGTRGVGSYGNGMGHGGMAGARRRTNTDFGSPYQGPVGASHVFMQQDMLAERERWLRQRFANIHTGWTEEGRGGTFYPSIGRGQHSFIQGGTSAAGMKLPGITGGSGNLQILDLSKWKVTADDADTITVKRGGIRGAVQSFFGMNRGYEFRLAGIDAPETFHGQLGMKSAQPHANDATLALEAMMGGTGNLSIVYDPENVTYGRMVGAVIADGRNVNFDLVKRGHVMALPFYKKDTPPLVDLKGIERLEGFTRRGEIGMWANPFFQVYSDVEDITGDKITLNTFSRMSKLATNATTMSLAGLMQNAQDQGFVSTADRIAAAEIGQRFKDVGYTEDYRNTMMLNYKNTPHNSYMHEMMLDSANLMKTRGSPEPYRTSRRGGYGALDKSLAIDTLGTTNSIWNKRKLSSYEVYGVERNRSRRRREDMAASQRHALRNMFVSPINHHRM